MAYNFLSERLEEKQNGREAEWSYRSHEEVIICSLHERLCWHPRLRRVKISRPWATAFGSYFEISKCPPMEMNDIGYFAIYMRTQQAKVREV